MKITKILSKAYWLIITWVWYKPFFKILGARTILISPRKVVGAKFVKIGSKCLFEDSATIYAVSEYAGEKFNPRLVIGDNLYANYSLNITCASSVVIRNNVTFAYNVSIFDFNHGFSDLGTPIRSQKLNLYSRGVEICDDVWVGANAFICGNVKIGKGAVVGANSVVKTDVPEYSVVAGNPARIIRSLRKNTGGES